MTQSYRKSRINCVRWLLTGKISDRSWNDSGKKKLHAQKTQIIVDKSGMVILGATFDRRNHLFGKYGYQGILKLHKNSESPKKKSKKHPLTKKDKKRNRSISGRNYTFSLLFHFTFEKIKNDIIADIEFQRDIKGFISEKLPYSMRELLCA